MAYMNPARKSVIAAALKSIIPAGWKYSLSVDNHSSIVLTIAAAPVDLLGEIRRVSNSQPENSDSPIPEMTHSSINHHYLARQFEGETLALFRRIDAAMHDGNHNNSDIQTDYFDVGWYVDINIGRWNKPFICTHA